MAGSSVSTDCQVALVSVNLTINSVSTDLSQSQFQNALPSNVGVVQYQDVIVASQATCDPGYYCPADTTTPVPCPAGTYNTMSNKVSLADCATCPQGSYCPLASVNPISCAAGSYMIGTGAVQQSDCTICPTGNYCPLGSITPTNCSAGTYNQALNSTSAASCQVCPVGQYCPIATTTPIACSAGSYRGTTGGTQQADCDICPAGNYCPIQSVTPTACSAGSYRGTTGGTQQADCDTCPAGNYCPIQSVTPTACSAGSYRGTTGGTQQGDCATCTTGNYCPLQSIDPINCTAGTFNPTTGGNASSSCLSCPAGQYCPLATTTPTACSAGTYRGTTGGTQQADCTTCPTGNYCPIQSIDPTNCSAGTYNTNTGSVDSSACLACPAGQYCPLATTTATSCSAGSYRGTTGGTQQADCATCPSGNYCPIQSINPTNCTAGTYNPSSGSPNSSSCLTCPAGDSCPIATTTPDLCSANTFSSAGAYTCTDCPSYSTSGVASPNNCTCTAGHTQALTTTGGSSSDVSYSVVGVSSYGGIEFLADVFTPPLIAALTINGYSNITILKGSRVTMTSVPFSGSLVDMTIYSGFSSTFDSTQTVPRSSQDVTYSGQQVIDFVRMKTIGTRVVYSTGVTGTGTATLVWDTTNVPPGIYYLGSTRTFLPGPNLQTFLNIFIASPVPVTLTYTNIVSTFLPVMASSGDTVKIYAQSGASTVMLFCDDLSDMTGGSAILTGQGSPFTFDTSSVNTANTFCYFTDGVGNPSKGQLYISPRPVVSVSPIVSTLSCPNCSSGYYSNAGDSACKTCGYGYYSAAVSPVCTVCPVGTKCNSTTTPAPVSCGLGNYQGSTGQSFCSTCPQDQYCGSQTTSVPISCPAFTTSTAGSYTLLQCRCVQGYVCSYTKRITTVVTLNTTLSRFNSDYGGVKTAFINAVASAAGVPSSQVTINTVTSSGGRRLLSFGDRGSIEVKVVVEGAERLHNLAGHLAKHNALLHQGHTWEESHTLQSSPEAPVHLPVFPVSGMRRPGNI